SFSSGNGQNLILKGDGTFTTVFDIAFDTQFHGNVLLQDLTGKFFGDAGYAGPTPDQIVFNMYSGAALVGGDTLDANNNGNSAHPANIMYGIFLDPNGNVSFVNTRLTGRIWGGDSQDMQIVSGDTLTQPTTSGGSTIAGVTEVGVPEPANIVLLGAALAALGGL